MLKDGKFVPGMEGEDWQQRRRQVFGLVQYTTPFVEPGTLVPVEIIEHRIPFWKAGRRTKRPDTLP